MNYGLRYLFDAGSGVCLWAASDEARERFGCAVEQWELPQSENAARFLQHLNARLDTSIDWSSPGDSDDHGSIEELNRCNAASANGLLMLRDELSGHGYDFIDETAA